MVLGTRKLLRILTLLAFIFAVAAGVGIAQVRFLQAIEEVTDDPFGSPKLNPGTAETEKPPIKELDIPAPSATPGEMHAEFSDQGALQLVLLDAALELQTRFGKLTIPVAEIRKIEFAPRLEPELREKIAKALHNLASENFNTREEAVKELFGNRKAAYPQLVKLTDSADQEVARRALELVEKIRETVPEEQLQPREYDRLTTSDSIISGTILATSVKVRTKQFGEHELKLADLRALSTQPAEEYDVLPKEILPDPGSLYSYTQHIGKTFFFQVTGNQNGSVWGTDLYTADTNLATACVHAGALKPGEAGIVKVTIVASPAQFTASTRNGISSHSYAQYPAAYKIAKLRLAKELPMPNPMPKPQGGFF